MINVGKKIKILAEGPIDGGLVEEIETIASSAEFSGEVNVIDSSLYAKVCFFEYENKKYIFKAFLKRGFLEFIKNILTGSRALRAKVGTELLIDNGLNAPNVLCLGEGTEIGDSFIVTDFIESEFNLATFLMFVRDGKRRWNMLHSLGKVIGLMHSKNLYHGDLRPGNVLIIDGSEDYKFCFIDNERNQERPNSEESMVITNLVQLNMLPLSTVGLTDRMRFYVEYCKAAGIDGIYLKKLARVVWHKTEERMATSRLGGLYN